jgi:hypothetical protein
MTRLLQPPEEGWRGRLSFITQILRNAFRLPDQADPRIRVALDTIDDRAPRGEEQAKTAIHNSDRGGSDQPGQIAEGRSGQAREGGERR